METIFIGLSILYWPSKIAESFVMPIVGLMKFKLLCFIEHCYHCIYGVSTRICALHIRIHTVFFQSKCLSRWYIMVIKT